MKPSFDDKQKNTLKIIDSSIASCEKVRGKLKEGSSQLSLNTNRLQALYLAKEILQNTDCDTDSQQIEQALIQITSIRRKSETGLAHAKAGSATYTRFQRLVEAMDVVLQGLETAKKNGVTGEEMAEILTHAAFYAGWSKAWAAFRMAKEVYAE